MKTKNILYITFPFLLIAASETNAQKMNISGDTIFVNTENAVQIKFPAEISNLRWMDQNPQYTYTSAPHSVILEARVENAKSSRLLVFEGPGDPRNHSFIVAFKKNIINDTYDFGTIKKLQQRIKEIEVREATKKAAVSETAPITTVNPVATKPVTNSTQAGNAAHYAILEEGDKALRTGHLDDAQSKYEEVLRLKPDNDYAQKKLAEVKVQKAEKERVEKQKIADKLNEIKSTANKAFYAKNYDEAIKGYNEALAINPNDVFSKSQIAAIQKEKVEIEAKEKQERDKKEKQALEDRINSIKATATKALNEKRYDDAILQYKEVLALSPKDAAANNQIDIIEKIKIQNELKTKQEAENKNRDETVKSILANADKAFDSKEYEVAKAGYLSAKEIKPNDLLIDSKIKITNERISVKESEEDYKASLDLGDEAQKSGDYEKAKAEFTKASKMFPQRTFPLERVKEINKIIEDQLAQKNAEKERQAKELQNNNHYIATIEKADKAFQLNDYANAKITYTQAASLKPGEMYPKDKLLELATILENLDKEKKAKADSIAAASELNKKYLAAMEKGKVALAKKDYATAKTAYSLASELKPAEQEPKNKLVIIENQNVGLKVNAKYDSALARGNIALGDRNYPVALENYQEALRAKPLETLPLSQITYVRSLITADSLQQAEMQRREEVKVQEEIRKKRFEEGMSAYASYEIAAQTANFEDQLLYLKRFLNIIPDASELNTYQYNAGAKIDFAKKKIQTIRDYLTRTKGSSYQLEPIPYTDRELEKKYESINVTAAPEEQGYAPTDSANYNENIRFSKEVLAAKARLSLVDSSDNVKLSCQSITFKNEKAFFKFSIQNNDVSEFLTGTMLLSLVKKDGTVIKNYASYIYPFPIVLPGKVFSIVYVAKDQEINDKDTFKFELNDRLKKKRLTISIPGNIYNEEKKALLSM